MKLNGLKVKIIAGRQGKSVADLARSMGQTTSNISRLLNNERNCRPLTACRIADALGVDVTEIIKDD